MDDLLNEFLTETNESIAVLDVELVELERNPDSPELLANIFRLVHTIKGTCGFLSLPRLEKVAHAGENVLGKVRDGELKADQETVSLILESLDRIKELVGILKTTEAEPEGDDSDLVDRLNAMAESDAPPAASGGTVDEAAASAFDFASAGTVAAGALAPDTPGALDPEPTPEAEAQEPAAPDSPPFDEADAPHEKAEAESLTPKGNGTAATLEIGAGVEASDETAAPPVEAKPDAAPAADSAIARQTIRVQVDVLEDLMNMVSELVLNRWPRCCATSIPIRVTRSWATAASS